MRIDEKNCMNCNMCVDNCKHNGITLVYNHDTVIHYFNDNCKSCGECISNCPAECVYED